MRYWGESGVAAIGHKARAGSLASQHLRAFITAGNSRGDARLLDKHEYAVQGVWLVGNLPSQYSRGAAAAHPWQGEWLAPWSERNRPPVELGSFGSHLQVMIL